MFTAVKHNYQEKSFPSLAEEKKPLISYRAQKATSCPICVHKFHQEMLLSGRGRLISQIVTPELRRLYKPNPKFGTIHPQVYSILTCEKCLYSSFPQDFSDLKEEEKLALKDENNARRQKIEQIFGEINFKKDRNLVLGAASYLLAVDCYQKRDSFISPTPKKAVCTLRAAWLFSTMVERGMGSNFDKICNLLYMKATHYYTATLKILTLKSQEPRHQFMNILGPDTDRNWNFDGVVYVNSYLRAKHYNQLASGLENKIKLLNDAALGLSKIYGYGKFSITKPSLILQLAQELHEDLKSNIEQLKAEKNA